MNRKNILILFLFSTCFLFISCNLNIPLKLKQEFKYCYDGKDTGIDSIINIQGYYSMGQPRDKYGTNGVYKHIIDTFYINFMFFSDGIFLYNFFDYNHNIPNYFNQIVESTNNGKQDPFFGYFCWGRYIFSNDTIKTQYYHIPVSFNDGWNSGEAWFKIISKDELQKITSSREKQLIIGGEVIKVFESLPAKFIPVAIIPSSDCKLKKQEWFWCNSSN